MQTVPVDRVGTDKEVTTPVSDERMRPVGDTPDDPAYDADVQRAVSDVLGRWGRGLDREPHDRIPDHTWEQLLAGLDAQQHHSGRRRLRALPGGRWTTPLVAVSAVALALLLGTTVLERTGTNDGPLVASGGTTESSSAPDAGRSGQTPRDAAGGPQILQAGFVSPAKKVMSVTDDIPSSTIADTVDELLAASGVEEPTDVFTMPDETWQPIPGEMTADPQTLRDCITKVTKVDTSQALLVVRAKVSGADVGLIVVPEFMVDMEALQGMDAADMSQMGRRMGFTTIYMVEPTCGMGAPDHDPTLLRLAFTLAP